MTAILDDPLARDHNAVDRIVVTREYESVEDPVARLGGEVWAVCVEDHEIGAAARGNGAGGLSERPGPALGGGAP